MSRLAKFIFYIAIALASFTAYAETSLNIPILCYHNLSPIPGSMNLTPQRFEQQIKWLKDNGFTFITLNDAVEYLQGKKSSLPNKSIVITADDGWKSDYTYMYPIVKKYKIPVTLFIYPETISAGKNALTWKELAELKDTGLFTIQSHTVSHPNFKQEKRRRSSPSYEAFVKNELVNSKKTLEDKLGVKISYLAWPFGIYDKYLEQAAASAGYDMAFTIDYRTANKGFRPMAQPRFMIVETESQKFPSLMKQAMVKTQVSGVKN